MFKIAGFVISFFVMIFSILMFSVYCHEVNIAKMILFTTIAILSAICHLGTIIYMIIDMVNNNIGNLANGLSKVISLIDRKQK